MKETFIDVFLVDIGKRTLSQAYIPEEEVEFVNAIGGVRNLQRPIQVYSPRLEAGKLLQFNDVWACIWKPEKVV